MESARWPSAGRAFRSGFMLLGQRDYDGIFSHGEAGSGRGCRGLPILFLPSGWLWQSRLPPAAREAIASGLDDSFGWKSVVQRRLHGGVPGGVFRGWLDVRGFVFGGGVGCDGPGSSGGNPGNSPSGTGSTASAAKASAWSPHLSAEWAEAASLLAEESLRSGGSSPCGIGMVDGPPGGIGCSDGSARGCGG